MIEHPGKPSRYLLFLSIGFLLLSIIYASMKSELYGVIYPLTEPLITEYSIIEKRKEWNHVFTSNNKRYICSMTRCKIKNPQQHLNSNATIRLDKKGRVSEVGFNKETPVTPFTIKEAENHMMKYMYFFLAIGIASFSFHCLLKKKGK